MKNKLAWIMIVCLCFLQVSVLHAKEVTGSVVLSGLPVSAGITGLEVSVGASVESYEYPAESLVTDSAGTVTLTLPAGYAQIAVVTDDGVSYYEGTVSTGEHTWTPVTEQLSLEKEDVTVSGNETTVHVGSVLSVNSKISGLKFSWQKMTEGETVWEEIGTGTSYIVTQTELGCRLRLVITKQGAYGKTRLGVADSVKQSDFILTPTENQNYVYNQCEKIFSYTVSDITLTDFQVEYRKAGENEYTSKRPVSAGSYDVKVTRKADTKYGAYEEEFLNAIMISKYSGKLISEFQCGNTVYTGAPAALIYTMKTEFENLPVTFSYKKKGQPDDEYTTAPPVLAGDYTVKAAITGNENYEADEAVADFTIAASPVKGENKVEPSPVYHLNGNQGDLKLKVGETKKIGFTSEGRISYQSSDGKIVSVDGSGNLMAKKPGTAIIVINVSEDTTLHASFSVKVSLKTPTKLKKSKVKKKSVKLSWKKCSGAVSYTVYRASKKKGKYKKIKTVKKTSYTDKKLKRKKTYYYKVKANAALSIYSSKQSSALKVRTKK